MNISKVHEEDLREEIHKIMSSVRNTMSLSEIQHKRIEELRGELYNRFHERMIDQSKGSRETKFHIGTESLPCDYKL